MSRPANGRYQFDLGGEWIGSVPEPRHNPQHLVLQDDSLTRRMRPSIHYDKDEKEIRVRLYHRHPDEVKAEINKAIRAHKPEARRLVIWIATARYQDDMDVYLWFKRNKLERDIGRENGNFFCLTRELNGGGKDGNASSAGNTNTAPDRA